MNQGIDDRANELSGASSDPFPAPSISVSVANSHRFGQEIAAVANPLALTPPGLIGLREHADEDRGKRAALLLFDAASPGSVLPAFAKLLISRFSAAERLSGVFAAVGAIHRDTDRDDRPNCVAHYWVGYDPQLARTEGKPDKLLGYLRRGVSEFASSGDLKPILERAADGLLRLASLLNPAGPVSKPCEPPPAAPACSVLTRSRRSGIANSAGCSLPDGSPRMQHSGVAGGPRYWTLARRCLVGPESQVISMASSTGRTSTRWMTRRLAPTFSCTRPRPQRFG